MQLALRYLLLTQDCLSPEGARLSEQVVLSLDVMSLPLVAIVGRPNVGKSTLFNRLAGGRLAIVADESGTTRDRIMTRAEWAGRSFYLVDTGGLDLSSSGELIEQVRSQVTVAIEEADVIVFLLDGSVAITEEDEAIANLLRRSGKPVLLGVNKVESAERELEASLAWSLGLGEPVPVSALHGRGTGDLLEALLRHLPPVEAEPETDAVRIAIVGRPNVGKSSLLNRLLGQERSIVAESPGTTRDPIDAQLSFYGQNLVLVDTAGIRRRGRIAVGIERLSVLRALRAIERSDVAALVLDASEGVCAQDAHIAGMVQEAGKGAILVVNKWDLLPKTARSADEYGHYLRRELRFLDYAPIVFVSALTGQRVTQVLSRAVAIYHARRQRIATSDLNRLVQELQARHNPPSRGRRQLRILYAAQVDVAPPTFVFFVNDPQLVHFSYQRFVENQLRTLNAFEGTPLRLVFRGRQRGSAERARPA